jgi:hypothetical protein
MHKQTIFVITAAIVLTAVVSAALYTVEAANAQGNATSPGGNMTAGNATSPGGNMTASPGGNMTAGNATK